MIGKHGLTKKQKEVLEHIIDFVNNNHRSPLIRELSERLDLASPTVSKHLDKLENKGYIEKQGSQGVRILSTPPDSEYVLIRKEVIIKALKIIYGNIDDEESRSIVIKNLESKLRERL